MNDWWRRAGEAGAGLVGDVLQECFKILFWETTGWRNTRLTLGVATELAFFAFQSLEKVFLTKVTSGGFESLGESVVDSEGHWPVQRQVLMSGARRAR